MRARRKPANDGRLANPPIRTSWTHAYPLDEPAHCEHTRIKWQLSAIGVAANCRTAHAAARSRSLPVDANAHRLTKCPPLPEAGGWWWRTLTLHNAY